MYGHKKAHAPKRRKVAKKKSRGKRTLSAAHLKKMLAGARKYRKRMGMKSHAKSSRRSPAKKRSAKKRPARKMHKLTKIVHYGYYWPGQPKRHGAAREQGVFMKKHGGKRSAKIDKVLWPASMRGEAAYAKAHGLKRKAAKKSAKKSAKKRSKRSPLPMAIFSGAPRRFYRKARRAMHRRISHSPVPRMNCGTALAFAESARRSP